MKKKNWCWWGSSQWPVVSGQWSVVSGQLLVVFVSHQYNSQSFLMLGLKEGDKMERTSFEKLRVYRLSEKLADEIWTVVLNWENFARDTVGKQLVRAADSIRANIAEGCGRGSYLDNRRFVRIARGSLNETKHWLRRAYKRSLLTKKQTENLRPIIEDLAPMLNAYLKSIGPSKVNGR
jgi:four helix bundle protein